jgi:hypothetical protein
MCLFGISCRSSRKWLTYLNVRSRPSYSLIYFDKVSFYLTMKVTSASYLDYMNYINISEGSSAGGRLW